MLQEDANRKRGTPASFAARARLTVPFRLTSYVQRGLRSPRGSFDKAARCTTASKPVNASAAGSRTSPLVEGRSMRPATRSQRRKKNLSIPATVRPASCKKGAITEPMYP
jgi:hypothetical protein